jgi:ADP-heptose:LPS heptosyltransferase
VNGIHKILFVRTDRIGDVLMNLPALKVLRQTYPKSWIALMLDENTAPLLEAQPEKDEVLRVSRARFEKDASYRAKVQREVRAGGFDMAVVSNASRDLHWMVFRAGIPVRVGYSRKWGFLLNKTLGDDKASARRHEIDSNLRLVAKCAEKKWDGRVELGIDGHAGALVVRKLASAGLAGKKFAVVHPGTSNERKRWPVENFAEICRWLVNEKKLPVVLIGGEEETADSALVAKLAGVPVTDWTGRLSLQELAAFFHSPDIAVLLSADSGPVHVAWMSGAPVAVLYAADVPGSDPERWGPKNGRSEIIYKPMKEISPAEVRVKIEKVLT